jgi:MobA/MobL family
MGKLAMPNLATWFTPSLQVMQRSKGRSAVAAAAYRACTVLEDERVGIQHDYRPKSGHVSTELFGVEGLKLGIEDIGTLWNAAEKAENRKNSAVARELMVPLPCEWTDDQRSLCVRGLSEMLVARYGVAVMASIHRPAAGQNNHVHIMFTTREVDAQMNFGKKTRILDDMKTGEVKKMREEVCRVVNDHAKANGADWYVYAGKFAEVDKSHIPTMRIPVNAPPELRETMAQENRAIVEARPLLTRIMVESKQTTAKIEAALKVIATTPDKKQLPDDKNVLNSTPSTSASPLSQAAQVRLALLSNSLDIQKAYREVKQAHTKRKEGREVANKWRAHLRELEVAPPSLLITIVAKMVRGLGVRDTVTIYEEKIAKARESIDQCRKNDERLTTLINDPARRLKYDQWQQWSEHRKRIDEYEATLPDAPRSNPQRLANSWDSPYSLSPQLMPKIPEPWN